MTMSGPQWLEERRRGIGGSDIAAVLGLSPWKTAYQVYQEKRKEVDDWKGNEATDWGKRLEPVLRQWYSDTTGRAVRVPEKILCHGRYPYMLASLDGFTDDKRIVEIKTARHGKGWGQPGTNEIPDYYALQCQHYMVVTGFEVTDVPVTIGGGSPELYEVPADREVQEMILDAAADFWRRVEAGDPPEPVSYADVVSRYGASRGAGAVYAKPEDLELIVKLRKVRETMTGLEEIEDEIKAKLILSIGEGKDTLTDADGTVLVTYRIGKPVSRFDSKAFEKDHPELYKSYLKTSEAQRRFLLK